MSDNRLFAIIIICFTIGFIYVMHISHESEMKKKEIVQQTIELRMKELGVDR